MNYEKENKPIWLLSELLHSFLKKCLRGAGIGYGNNIVLKAKAESSHAQHTARFETTKPTPQIGFDSNQEVELPKVNI